MSAEGVRRTEQLFLAMAECLVHGIEPEMASGAVLSFGHPEMIERLSSKLLELIAAREAATKENKAEAKENKNKGGKSPVRTLKLIAPSLVGYLITLMVEKCADQQLPPPPVLGRLIRAHHRADLFASAKLKRPGAYDRAVRFYLAYPQASATQIADFAGINLDSAAEWLRSGALKRDADLFKQEIPWLATNPELAIPKAARS
jgi:hypothetical protein